MNRMQLTRRRFAAGAIAAGLTATTAAKRISAKSAEPHEGGARMNTQPKQGGFWPDGARLAISVSMMFEGGGQPTSGAGGPIPEPIRDGLPDLPTNAFFSYGHYEGIPRALNLFDKHKIKVSSFMIGKAVENAPDLAQEIVRRGHEAAAHGHTWQNSYYLSRDDEKRFIASSQDTIEKITGQRPVGWNAYWLRNSVHILQTLQELGFLYSIDEPSHDEPFIIPVNGKTS